MSSDVSVISQTQKIVVDPATSSVSVILAGPVGPQLPPPTSEDIAELGAQMIYIHNGTSYELGTGRLFVGPEDPVADGFTMSSADEWIDPT